MVATALANATDIDSDCYVVLGLAHCFIKDDGEVHPVQVLEPIPSASLESLITGIPTSYSLAYATRIGEVMAAESPQRPSVFPADSQYCDDFAGRLVAAARTYHARPEAQRHIPLHTTYEAFQLSLDRKRVLNSQNIVKAEDNVKQHAYTHQTL